jgi:enoyl-CoA hydratase/carnithine racemase
MVCVNQFERLSIPTVAAVQGRCFGGGFELALRADLILQEKRHASLILNSRLDSQPSSAAVYRVAERAGRSKAIEWALTSEHIPSHVMERYGVVNSVVPDDRLVAEAKAFATKLASGPTRAHAAHKVLLRIWATSGVAAADEAMADIAFPLFDTEDVKLALPASVQAIKAKQPRPAFLFKGR